MSRVIAASCLLVLSACQTTSENDRVIQLSAPIEGQCVVALESDTFTMPGDQALLERHLANLPDKRRALRIEGSVNVPYRCIGGLIYALQKYEYPLNSALTEAFKK